MSSPVGNRLVVGLGNPGGQYERTRHNVGFRVVRSLADRLAATIEEPLFAGRFGEASVQGGGAGETIHVGLLQPWTYMNRSGESVLRACEALGSAAGLPLPPSDCLVVYDDLDLEFGRIRLRGSGGAGGHNGIGDVIRLLGTRDVPRLRFGISRPPQGMDSIDHVLGSFSEVEERELPSVIERSVEAILCWLNHGISVAMSEFNEAVAAPRNEADDGPA